MGTEQALVPIEYASRNVNGWSFNVGDQVAVLFQDDYYKATILKKKRRNEEEVRFFVHYVGWNKEWDQWVSPEVLYPITKDTICRRPFKRPRKEEAPLTDGVTLLIQVQIPRSLRRQLVYQADLVNARKFKITFPKVPSVVNILDIYLQHSTKRKTEAEKLATSKVLNGLRVYFDKALELLLLYQQERSQHQDNVNRFGILPASQIYGAEHFLRLFVKLPELIVYEGIPEPELAMVEAKWNDLLRFMEQNEREFFSL